MIHMRDVYSDNCSKLNIQNYSISMPESLLRVINLSSLTYPFFELDIEKYVMFKPLLIKQELMTTV